MIIWLKRWLARPLTELPLESEPVGVGLDDGLGRLGTASQGREIPQQLVNFQMRPNGGDGWLRLIEMRPDGTAQTYDYSPTRSQHNESQQNQFAFRVPTVGA